MATLIESGMIESGAKGLVLATRLALGYGYPIRDRLAALYASINDATRAAS